VIVVSDALPSSVTLADGLVEGGPVEGWLNGMDLAPEPEHVDLSRFTEGAVTLARVVKVTDLRANLVLHPLAPELALRRRAVVPGVDDGANEDVKVSDVPRVGQTVRVRVVADKGGIGLTLIGADDDLPFVPPLPILRGGSPWLREGVHAAGEAPEAAPVENAAEHTATPSGPAPTPSTGDPLTDAAVGSSARRVLLGGGEPSRSPAHAASPAHGSVSVVGGRVLVPPRGHRHLGFAYRGVRQAAVPAR